MQGLDAEFETTTSIPARELMAFYERQHSPMTKEPAKIERMMQNTFCFVTARSGGELIGLARGITDGVWGRLAECKLDPAYQGPACITKKAGRIEHDSTGIANEMARRVLVALKDYGVERIDALAYGTEVDFCEDLGFRRISGVVAMDLPAENVASGDCVVGAVGEAAS